MMQERKGDVAADSGRGGRPEDMCLEGYESRGN